MNSIIFIHVKEGKYAKKWKRNLLLLCLTVILVGLIGSGAALLYTEKERSEARNVEIDQVNFNKLHEVEYTGEYAGGMYKWRAKFLN